MASGRGGFRNTDYEAVAAGQTDQVLGPVGAKGDVLEVLIVAVDTLGAGGAVSIKDGGGAAIPITSATTPAGLYTVILGARSAVGAWSVTTGAAARAIGVGRFT
jgi:hypothetical protein